MPVIEPRTDLFHAIKLAILRFTPEDAAAWAHVLARNYRARGSRSSHLLELSLACDMRDALKMLQLTLSAGDPKLELELRPFPSVY